MVTEVVSKRTLQESLNRHFKFRDMVTPMLIRLTYAVGVLCILGFGVGMLLTALTQQHGAAMNVVSTLLITLLSLLLWRMFTEVGMLAFELHARLAEIRDLLALRAGDAGRHEDASPASTATEKS